MNLKFLKTVLLLDAKSVEIEEFETVEFHASQLDKNKNSVTYSANSTFQQSDIQSNSKI